MALHPPILHRMDVVKWALYQFTLPCHPPLYERSGLIVKLSTGWGEISPLAGRSLESFDEAKEQVIAYLHGKKDLPLYPSVACGLDSAQRKHLPHSSPLPLCALLHGTYREILDKADTVFAQGYRTVKVKVGHLSFAEAKFVLNELTSRFSVRVDVNQVWSYNEALSFFSQFDRNAFEYIEDPIREVEMLDRFPHPFALDAALSTLNLHPLAAFHNLRALVIKPMLIGGLTECLKIKKLADQFSLKLVMSSAWESGLGILQLCALCRDLNISTIPLGVDTYRWMKEDVLSSPLDFSQPELMPPSSLAFNMDLLKEIAHG